MERKDWERGLKERQYLPFKFNETNKKSFIIGANFGPFKDNLFVDKHKEFFTKFEDVCLRDSYSYNLFKDLSNVRFAPDVVFNMKLRTKKNPEKCIGLSIIDLEKRDGLKKYYQKYNEKIIQLVEKYIELGYKIKFFSFCENEGDLNIIKYISGKVNADYINQMKIINYDGNINSFLDEFKSCEVVLGTRFHSIILALLFNQGVYPIIYSDKTYNVLKDLGIENHCCYIKEIGQLDINKVISKAPSNRLKNKSVISKAAKQFDKLDAFILENQKGK